MPLSMITFSSSVKLAYTADLGSSFLETNFDKKTERFEPEIRSIETPPFPGGVAMAHILSVSVITVIHSLKYSCMLSVCVSFLI